MLHRHGLVADFFDLIDAVGFSQGEAGGVIFDEIEHHAPHSAAPVAVRSAISVIRPHQLPIF
jgi:hypothetical protein